MNNKEINREAIRLSRTIETQKAEKLFRYNATHYPCGLTINNLAWFLYLEYAEYDKKKLISMFKEAHSLCPNIKSLLATAQVYYDLNRFYRAEKILNRILENHYNTSALSLLMVTKLYLRSMDDEAHVDAITGEQYTTKNIITYQVKNRTIDSTGRQDLKNVGSGEGYYISNGYAVPITWEKASRSSQTVYKYMDGTEIDVNDGVTWIQIQPVGKELGIEANEEEYNDTEE